MARSAHAGPITAIRSVHVEEVRVEGEDVFFEDPSSPSTLFLLTYRSYMAVIDGREARAPRNTLVG